MSHSISASATQETPLQSNVLDSSFMENAPEHMSIDFGSVTEVPVDSVGKRRALGGSLGSLLKGNWEVRPPTRNLLRLTRCLFVF